MMIASQDYFNWAQKHGVGLLNESKEFAPVRFALTPYVVSSQDWNYLTEASQALMELMLIIREDPSWLIEQLTPMLSTDTLIKELLVLLKDASIKRIARSLILARYDFVLNTDKEWKLIESNTIAAGMGPMCEQVVSLQQKDHDQLAQNPALEQQSLTLFTTAQSVRNANNPLILFLIEEQEDNVFDQRMLAQAVERRGAKVAFSTFKELVRITRSQPDEQEQLVFNDAGVVDLIYFRTGYNLIDYQNEKGDTSVRLALRNKLEQFELVVCPSIADQLVSSKWLQMILSEKSVKQLMKLGLDQQKAKFIYDVLNVGYQVASDKKQIEGALSSGNWLLKSHGEGGGNVKAFTGVNKLDEAIKQKHLLMERIQIKPNDSGTSLIENGERVYIVSTTTEIGIFVDSERLSFNGYLARTKPTEELECGVHRARGMINGVALKDD